ncbi:hypothetical protein MNBD_BACTEROID07-889 [hydrothermal vent metagenome]|uniref:Copper-binding protein MbnP-like domain-containing protein n=1 Tax=hydrothermal vent metagenome TaxID=652676 RepID=A0A3B0VA24_9ZZZZ
MNFWKKHLLKTITLLLLTGLLLAFASCKKTPAPEKTGHMMVTFEHSVGQQLLEYDTIKYVNAAGNPYMVTNIQYFISDICLHKVNGDSVLFEKNDQNQNIHYVDTDLPDTWQWQLPDSIPEGQYSSISFTFGLNKKENVSLRFPNPPESAMFWPQYLGGGYHYMKLNGKWRDTSGVIHPFNFHLGIGQEYDSLGKPVKFIQNYFKVTLPKSSFSISGGQTVHLALNMDVNEWFENPNVFDLNVWGGKIMQNQTAMHLACQNGHNVFTLKNIQVLLPEK